MKKLIFSIILIIIFGFLVFARLENTLSKTDNKSVIITNQEGNDVIVNVDIARTSSEHAQGLSDREELPEGRGMLFVFKEKEQRSFHMKDMNFPIDIIWLSDDKITRISRNLPPEGKNPSNRYSSENPVNYVLEVPANFCEQNNISVGNSVFYKY